jgi:hypothetical protein
MALQVGPVESQRAECLRQSIGGVLGDEHVRGSAADVHPERRSFLVTEK